MRRMDVPLSTGRAINRGWDITSRANQGIWRRYVPRNPAFSAWPFVVVILAQMALGGFSVYTLSATRTFITGESLWSKGQHEAVYFLDLYLETGDQRDLDGFKRTIAVPLAYREGREALESTPPDAAATRRAFIKGGTAAKDISSVIWMFRHFRGFPYLEDAVTKWKEADRYILELAGLGAEIATQHSVVGAADLRKRVEHIDTEITPRTVAFSRSLDDGARFIEQLLLLANFALAGLLTALTVWRVSKFLTVRRQIEEELAWQASHDELTGLENRRSFEDRLLTATRAAKGGTSACCALMFIDLDQFKIVNDTCGHAAGDALLRRICPALQNVLGPGDSLGRLGGDEFSVLMPGVDRKRALETAESLREAVERVGFVWENRPFNVTASIGLVHDDLSAISPDEMMRAADLACFMAKEMGRNRVHSHRAGDERLHGRVREMNWVQRIHQALADDRFCLYGQEIVALTDTAEAGIHLEVLIRMRGEDGALISSASFLPAAERFGLATLIDRWVVRRAFRTLGERRRLPHAPPITRCAINLSGATIGDEAFLDFLKQAFAEFRITPQSICFEVTETSAILNIDAARSFIQDLRGLGCTFALDDFGSGMSSFTYLKELPVDTVKIDGSFVRNLLTDRADRAMVEMIAHVGHIMGKRIVAEFVENGAIAGALRDIGVDYGQGFGIARPKPFDADFTSVGADATPIENRLIA